MGHFQKHGCHYGETGFVYYAVTLIIGCAGLLLTIMVMIGLYGLVRKDRVAPIYIINLLITDFLQLLSFIVMATVTDYKTCYLFNFIQFTGVLASILFMLVISIERYLIVGWPLWYRYRRNTKTSMIVCAVVWISSLLYLIILIFVPGSFHIAIGIFLIIPLPLLLFSLVGTVRAVTAAISLPADEKRRIVATLVLVLLIYVLLFVPWIVYIFTDYYDPAFELGTLIPSYLSPLADLFLYFFMKKSFLDRFLAALCCRTIDQNGVDETIETVDTLGSDTHAGVVEGEADRKTEV